MTEHKDELARHFISVKEAALYLNVSYRFLMQKIWDGEGPPGLQRIGYRWKIPKDDFLKWSKSPVLFQQQHTPSISVISRA